MGCFWQRSAPPVGGGNWQFDPIVRDAVADEVGCRAYLMALGDVLGYPEATLGPILCGRGKGEWSRSIGAAGPHVLGRAALRTFQDGFMLVARPQVPEAAPNGRYQTTGRVAGKNGREENSVTIVKPGAGGGTQLADGYYPAVISEITESSRDWPSRNDPSKMETVNQFVVQFIILDDDGKRTTDEIRGYCRQAWSQRSTLFKWSSAILGRKCPKADEEFDTELLLKRRCDLQVVNQKSAQGTEYSKVADVYPYRSMTAEEDEEPSTEPVGVAF